MRDTVRTVEGHSRKAYATVLALLCWTVCTGLWGCATTEQAPKPAETSAEVQRLLGKAFDTKDVEAERAKYEAVLKIHPRNPVAHNNLGICCLKMGEYFKAAEYFSQAMRLLPESAVPQFNMGLLYEVVGKPEKAVEYYQRAVVLAPADPRYRVCLARAHFKTGKQPWRTQQLIDEALKHEMDPEAIAWLRETRQLLRKNQFDFDPILE